MIDLDDLRKKAEAATPGPWEAVHGDEVSCVCEPTEELTWDDHGGYVFRPEDASHIATFDPPTVLALIDELKRARRAARTLGKVVEGQCRDIAQITNSEHMVAEDGDADWEAIWSRGRELGSRADAAEAAVARARALHHRWVRRDGPVVCAWCDANGSGDAEWPCRTIRALDGEDA